MVKTAADSSPQIDESAVVTEVADIDAISADDGWRSCRVSTAVKNLS